MGSLGRKIQLSHQVGRKMKEPFRTEISGAGPEIPSVDLLAISATRH